MRSPSRVHSRFLCLPSLTFLAVGPEEASGAGAFVALQAGFAGPPVLARAGLLSAGMRAERRNLNGAADVLLLQDGDPFDGNLSHWREGRKERLGF